MTLKQGLDDWGTPRAVCVARIKFHRTSVVESGMTGVFYSRREGRPLERNVSARVSRANPTTDTSPSAFNIVRTTSRSCFRTRSQRYWTRRIRSRSRSAIRTVDRALDVVADVLLRPPRWTKQVRFHPRPLPSFPITHVRAISAVHHV